MKEGKWGYAGLPCDTCMYRRVLQAFPKNVKPASFKTKTFNPSQAGMLFGLERDFDWMPCLIT